MSDMKLFEGINHIDDDLINEANVPARRPKYYTFALSAAAILLVIGLSGIAFGGNENYSPRRYISGGTSSVVPSESNTTVASSSQIIGTTYKGTTVTASNTVTSNAANKTSHSTAINNKDSVLQTETSLKTNTNVIAAQETIKESARTSAATSKSTMPVSTATAAVTTVQETTVQPVTTDVYENEGSYDMKKLLSMLTSAVMLSPIAAQNAYSADNQYKDPAERYGLGTKNYSEEVFEVGPAEQELFDRIDQGLIDIDIDRNGELDMRDAALLYFYEVRKYCVANPDADNLASLYINNIANYDMNNLPQETREFLENRENIRNKELFSKSRNYWDYSVATLDSTLLVRYHLTHTLKPEYFTKEYYSDIEVYDVLTNYKNMIHFDYFFYLIGSERTNLLNQIRGSFFTELDPLYDVNGDGVFDPHDIQDYVEYQFGYTVSADDYDAIANSDSVDMKKYRQYTDSDDSISEKVFKNCVNLEKVNLECERVYGFDYQREEEKGSLVRIGFQKMIELFFMKNDFKLVYTTPEYYTNNRPGCEGLPLYDRIDLYSFISQYAGSHGYTTEKLGFDENAFNLFYENWSASVKNKTADIPDINGNGIIDKEDLSFIQQYEKELWQKIPAEDSLLPEEIRKYLDEDFDLNDNGLSGDLYDVMGAILYIRANYPELKNTGLNTNDSSAKMYAFPIGDVNCDNITSIADSVAILQFIGNRDRYNLTEEGRKNADVNGDGSITPLDALEIQKMDAGLIE